MAIKAVKYTLWLLLCPQRKSYSISACLRLREKVPSSFLPLGNVICRIAGTMASQLLLLPFFQEQFYP